MWEILGPILGVLVFLLLASYLIWVLRNWVASDCDSPLAAFMGECDEWEVRQGNPWD